MQKALKPSSLLSYMLKPSNLLTQGFGNNMTSHDKLLNQMCNLWARKECREEIIVVSSYLNVDTTKDQCSLLNPTPLDCITCFILDDDVSERALNRLPQRRLKFINGYISSYCYILNSPEQL